MRSVQKELDWETAPDSLTVREAAALLRLRKVFDAVSEQTGSTAAFNHLPGGVK